MLSLTPALDTPESLTDLYDRLSRWPDIQAENLFAVDAADRLLVDTAAAMLEGHPLPRLVVFGEMFGAVTLGLASRFPHAEPVLVVTDSQVHRNALYSNAVHEDMLGRFEFAELEDLSGLLGNSAVLCLAVAPRAHIVAEQWADAAARLPGCQGLLLGGRIKHMSLGLNEALGEYFSSVQASRARQKARLLWASGPRRLPARQFTVQSQHDVGFTHPLTVAAVPGAFGADRIDPGTRVMLPILAEELLAATPPRMVDLGCGNGTVAAFAKILDPELEVCATDVSRAAIRSTQLTAEANGAAVETVLDDALSTWPDASEDFIVLNPPFHAGNTVTEDIAHKLFQAAGRVLRPGGTLLTVWNAPLAYSQHLRKSVGPTQRLGGNQKFQVTRSVKNG